MDGKSPGYPQAQGPVGYAFLSRREVSLLRRLIHDRRSLPVYRVDGWLCYECAFACPDLAAMVRHILRAHGAVPADEEDVDEDGHNPRLLRRVGDVLCAQNLSARPHGGERQGKSSVHAGDEGLFRVLHETALVSVPSGSGLDVR